MTERLLIHLWKRVQGGVVQEVSEEDAVCVFDCGKGQCTFGEWETCDRRLHKAAGELMPLLPAWLQTS
jgi:hypothetical protein